MCSIHIGGTNMETKKFKIFGEPWDIKWIDCIKNPENPEAWKFGETDTGEHLIRISTQTIKGKPIKARSQEVTKMHELVHAILDEGQFLEESVNEPLVEWLAKCLVSLKEQKML